MIHGKWLICSFSNECLDDWPRAILSGLTLKLSRCWKSQKSVVLWTNRKNHKSSFTSDTENFDFSLQIAKLIFLVDKIFRLTFLQISAVPNLGSTENLYFNYWGKAQPSSHLLFRIILEFWAPSFLLKYYFINLLFLLFFLYFKCSVLQSAFISYPWNVKETFLIFTIAIQCKLFTDRAPILFYTESIKHV